MYIYSDTEPSAHQLPDVEVFELDQSECDQMNENEGEEIYAPGWYWWSCFPGCLPDADPIGPFETEEAAAEDARGGM